MKILVEDVRYQDDHTFGGFQFFGNAFDCPYHIHPEFELTLILSGKGYRLTGDHFGHFEPGDLILFGSNLPHHYQNWENDKSAAHSQYVQFRYDKMGFRDLPEFRSISLMLKRAARGIHFPASCVESTKKWMDLIEQAHDSSSIAYLILMLNELANESEYDLLASVGYTVDHDEKKAERLQRVLKYIDEHYQSKIELEDLGLVACLHPQSFSRFFKQNMGKSFQGYLKELRLSHAKREMIMEEKTITQIAFESGFSNLSNFNRLFKREYSMTPSDYLKNIRSQINV